MLWVVSSGVKCLDFNKNIYLFVYGVVSCEICNNELKFCFILKFDFIRIMDKKDKRNSFVSRMNVINEF